jgi:hypothetical protein
LAIYYFERLNKPQNRKVVFEERCRLKRRSSVQNKKFHGSLVMFEIMGKTLNLVWGRAVMGKISVSKKKTHVRDAELLDWLLAIDASIR